MTRVLPPLQPLSIWVLDTHVCWHLVCLLTCSLQSNELWPWNPLALVPMTDAPSITKRGPSGPFEPSASCLLTPWRTQSSHHSAVHSWITSFPFLLPFDWQSENSWFATWSMGFVTMACRWAFHIKCGTYGFLLMVCLFFFFCSCCLVSRCSKFVTILVQEPHALLWFLCCVVISPMMWVSNSWEIVRKKQSFLFSVGRKDVENDEDGAVCFRRLWHRLPQCLLILRSLIGGKAWLWLSSLFYFGLCTHICLCVIIYHVYMGTGGGQKVTDPLKLKLQVVSRPPEAVTGNWTLVL